LRRTHVRVSLRATADCDAWALAGGGQIGPIAMSAGAARGASAAWQLHVFGRRLARSSDEKKRAPRARRGAIARRVGRELRRLDPTAAALLGLDAFARVRWEGVRARVGCGFADPAATGRVAGAIAIVSAALAPVATIDSAIDWTSEHAALDLT